MWYVFYSTIHYIYYPQDTKFSNVIYSLNNILLLPVKDVVSNIPCINTFTTLIFQNFHSLILQKPRITAQVYNVINWKNALHFHILILYIFVFLVLLTLILYDLTVEREAVWLVLHWILYKHGILLSILPFFYSKLFYIYLLLQKKEMLLIGTVRYGMVLYVVRTV